MPEKDANKIFCDNLKKLLKKEGMLRSDLAEKIGVSKSTVSMWMSGYSSPRMDLLDKIADVFGVSVAYLMTGIYTEPSFYLPQKGNITLEESILVNKYRSLDDHGKEIVDFVLMKEYERCEIATCESKDCLNATYDTGLSEEE